MIIRRATFVPLLNTVNAVVVRNVVAVAGLLAINRLTNGAVSHRFDMTNRMAPVNPFAIDANITPVGPPLKYDGCGLASKRATARANTPIAVDAGGADEWPASI
jgi:hypothetical protein